MLSSAQMLAQLLRSYERRGIDVSSMKKGQRMCDRNDAHWPKPECLGGELKWPLLKDGHMLLDLLVSEELQHCCFHAGETHKLLKMLPEELDSEVAAMFWNLYEKWVSLQNKGKSIYRDETGKVVQLTPDEALELGYAHANAGKSCFRDPETGATASLTKEEAEVLGWVSIITGTAAYMCPTTGEIERLTKEEAEERGWVGVLSGRANFKCPETGKTECLTSEEAKSRGWVGASAGTATYECPSTGERALLTREEAERRGWKGLATGKSIYRCPETGATARLTREEAEARGWINVVVGTKHDKVRCPHCGKEVASNVANQFHFDNCFAKEGSWRWLKEQLKEADPKWRKTDGGKWTRSAPRDSPERYAKWLESLEQGRRKD